MADVRAFQRTTRQSPYKMRLVIDQIRGKNVNDALALLVLEEARSAADREGAALGGGQRRVQGAPRTSRWMWTRCSSSTR